jgi:hypothetical protein
MGEESKLFESLLALLPKGWEAAAKTTKALQRGRVVGSAQDLLRLILLYLTEGVSFAGTSALGKASAAFSLTKTAVWSRIKNSAEWLRWLCAGVFRERGLLEEKPAWLGGRNVLLIDASEARNLKRKLYRLHYSVDLFSLTVKEFHITGEERGETLENFVKLGPGDIALGDRGYGTIAGMEHVRELGSDFVLRLRGGAFGIYDEAGRERSILRQFTGLKAGESGEYWCYYRGKDGEMRPVRLCAYRKDWESERRGLEGIRKTNGRKHRGKAITKKQRAYNRYVVVATSLGDEGMSAARVMELYRLRWQIERAFKRLKTLFDCHELPAKLDATTYALFYGKLLLAALCEQITHGGRFSPWGGRKDGSTRGTAGATESVAGDAGYALHSGLRAVNIVPVGVFSAYLPTASLCLCRFQTTKSSGPVPSATPYP